MKLYFEGDQSYLGARDARRHLRPACPSTTLAAYLEMLDGCDLPWAVAVIGGDVVGSGLAPRARLGRSRPCRPGGSYRTDEALERELVEQVRALAEAVGRPVATPAVAAQLLDLPR